MMQLYFQNMSFCALYLVNPRAVFPFDIFENIIFVWKGPGGLQITTFQRRIASSWIPVAPFTNMD